MSKTFKLLPIIVTFFALFLFQNNSAKASAVDGVCNPDDKVYENTYNNYPDVDTRLTGMNVINTLLTNAVVQATTGRSTNDFAKCGVERVSSGRCSNVPTDCDEIDPIYNAGTLQSPLAFANNRHSGSLLGLANSAYLIGRTQPIPVHFAFWMNDKIEGVPMMGSTLAAQSVYSGPFLASTDQNANVVLSAWKLGRDVAYAIMSVVMLVTGIMIITGKKLGPQVTVTVQTALPRIVIAAILIAFTYPIGATLASLSWSLGFSMWDLISSYFGGSQVGLGAILAGAFGVALLLGLPIGIPGLLVVLSPLIITLILWIIAWIKIFIIYLKILATIVWSPVALAIGAIPGREETTKNLVNTFMAYLLAIPLMQAVMRITLTIVWSLLNQDVLGSDDMLASIGVNVLALIIGPTILIFGFYYAIKIPGKVEAAIKGPKRR